MLVNASNILICFKGFWDYLQLELFDAKNTDARNACIGVVSADSICARDVYIGRTYINQKCLLCQRYLRHGYLNLIC